MSREDEREDREIAALLAHLDHPVPAVAFEDIVTRAARRRPRLRRLVAGAALVLGLGAVAYALPGSPLPGWMDRILALKRDVPRAGPQEDASPGGPEPSLGGIAVAASENLFLRFESVQPGGSVVVYPVDGTDVAVRAPRGAATFTSDEGVIVVRGRQPGVTYQVQIPRLAPRVEIQLDGRRVLLKEGSRWTPPLPEGAPAIVIPTKEPGR